MLVAVRKLVRALQKDWQNSTSNSKMQFTSMNSCQNKQQEHVAFMAHNLFGEICRREKKNHKINHNFWSSTTENSAFSVSLSFISKSFSASSSVTTSSDTSLRRSSSCKAWMAEKCDKSCAKSISFGSLLPMPCFFSFLVGVPEL